MKHFETVVLFNTEHLSFYFVGYISTVQLLDLVNGTCILCSQTFYKALHT